MHTIKAVRNQGAAQPPSRLRAPGRSTTTPRATDSGAARHQGDERKHKTNKRHKISTRLDTQAGPKFGGLDMVTVITKTNTNSGTKAQQTQRERFLKAAINNMETDSYYDE